MPSGRPKGPLKVVVPEGYCRTTAAAERLGCTIWNIAVLVRTGQLQAQQGPKIGRGYLLYIKEASLSAYQRTHPTRQPRQKTVDAAPVPWQPRQGIAMPAPSSNGPKVPTAPRRPLTLWTTLASLEAQRRDLWVQLKAGVPDALRDEYYLLARRLCYTELALLEQLYGEPEPPIWEKVDWFGEEEEEDG